MDLGYDSIEASRIENEKKEELYSQLITIELKHELLEMKGKEKENSKQIKITNSKETMRERSRERGRDENEVRKKAQEKKVQTRKSLVDDNQILNDEKNKNITGITGSRSFVRPYRR